MKTNPNDPSTPCKVTRYSGHPFLGDTTSFSSGLTKREYFAVMAMRGMADNDECAEEIAANAVKIADALIAELNKTS